MATSTAIHEAGHAVVAHAFDIPFGRQAIRIDPLKGRGHNDNVGEVSFEVWNSTALYDLDTVSSIAIDLAGGIAERRAGFKSWAEWASDISFIALTLATKSGHKTKIRAAMAPITSFPPFQVDIANIMLVLCSSPSTQSALELFKPKQAERIKRTPHFKTMAESADVARSILDKNWQTVCDLAEHLQQVRKMSGRGLTSFLNRRMAKVARAAAAGKA